MLQYQNKIVNYLFCNKQNNQKCIKCEWNENHNNISLKIKYFIIQSKNINLISLICIHHFIWRII